MKSIILFLVTVVFFSKLHAQEEKKPDDYRNIFEKIEVEATFPGGEAAWRSYLVKSLDFQVAVNNYAPPGSYTVIIQFIVDKDGTLMELKPLTQHGFGMEEEVMRVIWKGPKWIPATQNGKIVRAFRKQSVTFQVEGDFTLSTYTIPAAKPTSVELKVDRQDVKAENLEVTLSSGTITHDTGDNFIITVDNPGRILLTIKNKAKKKKDIEHYGTVAIDVK